MYNIKQAAARAGVSVPVLRAWERRYGIVHPQRTASGYRQFDDEAVDRVRSMRALIAQGWSPSAAAAAIVAGTAGTLDAERPVDTTGRARAAGASGASGRGISDADADAPRSVMEAPGAQDLAERFVAAAADLDPRRIDMVLDDLFARGSFERVASDLLFPALRRLGDAWAAGRVNVAGEHMASAAVLRRLGLALDAASRLEDRDGPVVVGLPPGGRHELGALAFAVACRRAGMAVTYLGADLPVEDWLAAATGAAAAVIGVVTARDRSSAMEVARRLRAANEHLVIAFGGRAVPPAAAALGVMRLPDHLPDAVDTLAGAARRERREHQQRPRPAP
jgi:DNA-binding transcriptional MerR regulator/methylmalonyl-CoA mutase cobalamin-binding subunit